MIRIDNYYCLIPVDSLNDELINASISFKREEMPIVKVKESFLWFFSLNYSYYVLEFIWDDLKNAALDAYPWFTEAQIKKIIAPTT